MDQVSTGLQKEPYPWRGFLVGALLCAALAWIEPHVKLKLHTNGLCTDYINAGALVFLLTVVLLCGAIRWISGWRALGARDVALVFAMLVMACAVPSHGLLAPLLPVITGGSYYTTEVNSWNTLILSRLPESLFVRGDAAQHFYERLPEGQPFPWAAWFPPVIAWGILIAAVYTVMIATVILLFGQWTRHERLAFPLVRPAQEIAKVGDEGSFLRQPLFWLGFGISFLVVGSRALAFYVPDFPVLRRIWYQFPMIHDTTRVTVVFSFVIVGFSYLLSARLLFSIWFFHLAMKVISGLLIVYGNDLEGDREPWGGSTLLNTHINGGAMLALALFGFWAGRAHLGAVFREAVHPGREGGREYRLALVAVLAGLVVIGGWLYWAGFPGPVVPLVILLCFLTVIGLTRIVVQGGVGFMCSGMPPGAMAYSIAGPNVLGAQGVAAITTLYTWAFEFRTTVMASAAQGFRMLEACRTRIRIIPLAVALLIVLGISSVVTVRLAYQVGGANLRTNWFRGMAQTPYQVVSRKLNSPITSQMVERRWAAMGAGAAAMGTLMFCNWRFHWFPLHYIGFPIADVWMMNQIWASVFVAWLLKLLMLRYGGARAYSRSIALAIGLVFGQILVAALFMLVDSITGRVGNFVDVGLG